VCDGLTGARDHVWAVRAQNAGKSRLSNAMAKCVSWNERKVSCLMEAPLTGRRWGLLEAELYDSELKSLEGKTRISCPNEKKETGLSVGDWKYIGFWWAVFTGLEPFF